MTLEEALFKYHLRMGDNALILGQRLGELCGHGPELEEDMALTNIALDLIGQARELLRAAGELEGKGRSEDDLAFLRTEREFYNVKLVELPNGDYAHTIARNFFYDSFDMELQQALTLSKDPGISGLAQKCVKEVKYHLRHSSEWVIRMGDGTKESHQRIQTAIGSLWTYTGELFESDDVETQMVKAGIGPDPRSLKRAWDERVNNILKEATLDRPNDEHMATGGRIGLHTEHMGPMLAEMQYLQRAYPGVEW